MKNILLEIGTEELPTSVINSLSEFIGIKLKELTEAKEVIKFSTPRRLAFILKNVPEVIEGKKVIIYGPPWHVAFDGEGNPTKALTKFLEKNNAKIEDVIKVKRDKGEYTAIEKSEKGESPIDRIKGNIEEIIRSVPAPKKMRWDSSGITFPRPIRWIVALYNEEVIDIKVGNIRAGRETLGHRLLNPHKIEIKRVEDYESILKEANIIPSFEERLNLIKKSIEEESKRLGGVPAYPEGLPEEVANLVEYPFIISGEFDAKYLDLPELVIITVSAHHQRFVCVKGKDGNLLPYFIAVSNNGSNTDAIRKGYERVLKARLEDALFFYNEDLKVPLYKRVEELKGILQHPKIGNMFDKVKRLEDISVKIGTQLGFDEERINKLKRASLLSKADLLTEMVKELDELQGYMGYIYALRQGEDEEVATAIYEHYKPKGSDDELPRTDIGAVLSIADKWDNLISYFSVGETPKGNSDPHGLRRAFAGILRIIFDRKWDINIRDITKVPQELEEFTLQRTIAFFEDYPYDVVRSVMSVSDPLVPLHIKEKIERLTEIKDREEFKEIVEAYKRISRIIPKNFKEEEIKEELLKEEAERELYYKLKDKLNAEDILDLHEMVPYINNFFDKVLVMEKDENLRNNRLALLLKIKKLFMRFGDLDQIVSKEVVCNG